MSVELGVGVGDLPHVLDDPGLVVGCPVLVDERGEALQAGGRVELLAGEGQQRVGLLGGQGEALPNQGGDPLCLGVTHIPVGPRDLDEQGGGGELEVVLRVRGPGHVLAVQVLVEEALQACEHEMSEGFERLPVGARFSRSHSGVETRANHTGCR